MTEKVAIIGTGLIGRAWAISFARGGFDVALWDVNPEASKKAQDICGRDAAELERHDLLNGESAADVLARISALDTLDAAVDGVVHIQENGPEELSIKQALARDILKAAPENAILATSSSALLPSLIFEGLEGRERCLVAHPINPPSHIPAVELVPGPDTSTDTMERTARVMVDVGQNPVQVLRELNGFIVNRLQGALLDEAFRLVGEGYAEAEDIDKCIRDGLALRWALMGPFETIDLNAPGGLEDYVNRYDPMYARMNVGGGPRQSWQGDVLRRVLTDRRSRLPIGRLAARREWRDTRLLELRAFKRANNLEGKERAHD